MKKIALILALVLPLTAGLSGCVIKINDDDYSFDNNNDDRAYKNRKKIAKVLLDSSFMDIQKKLGVADFTETFRDGDDIIRVLYYRTQSQKKDGITTKDECTFLKFINGKLIQTGTGEPVLVLTEK